MAPAPAVQHLYVHVPFCPTICPFCSFHVTRRRDDLVDAYLTELDREAAEVAERLGRGPLRTVYLGGGTPTHLTDGELERLLGSIRRRFDLDGKVHGDVHGDVHADIEVCLEAHPANVTAARARNWRTLGITRISVGVQSTSDDVLRFLGRPHDAAAGLAALDAVRSVQGWSVNADLITAVPGQDVAADLRRLASVGIDHLSAYTLTIEPNTPFARRRVAVDAVAEAAALQLAGEVLPGFGLHRYEVSNHARPGQQCAHNRAYWEGRFWAGIGPSASAHEPGPTDHHPAQRRTNPGLAAWLAGERGDPELLERDEVVREAVFVGLRLRRGVDLVEVGRRVTPEVDVAGRYRDVIDELVAAGRLERDGSVIRATEAGLLFLDQVAAAFL